MPNEPLTREEVSSPQLVEPENPNDAHTMNPGDPTVSWNSDGTLANQPAELAATVPVNPTPSMQSDPAHVPSPYQPPEIEEDLKRTAKLREDALQSENRFRIDRTPNVDVDLTPRVDENPIYTAEGQPAYPAEGQPEYR